MTQESSDVIYLTQRELEARWRMSGRTLERWRVEGFGPDWYVLGGSIRYRLGDIADFEDRHRHETAAGISAADPGCSDDA